VVVGARPAPAAAALCQRCKLARRRVAAAQSSSKHSRLQSHSSEFWLRWELGLIQLRQRPGAALMRQRVAPLVLLELLMHSLFVQTGEQGAGRRERTKKICRRFPFHMVLPESTLTEGRGAFEAA
tara:strand:+ start:340 stop:714 length:375 start_codon:yes stop_codon:yes gene_type:complete